MNRVLCDAGHESHETVIVDINLNGENIVREYPAIPEHLAKSFQIEVYDHAKYNHFRGGYCQGQDEHNLAIILNKCWEGFDTLVFLTVLDAGDRKGLVLDFGANVGWYSILAASCGYKVKAYDAVQENLDVLKRNAERNGLSVDTKLMWFDEKTKPAPFKKEVEFLKADVEGAEEHVVRYCSKLFENQLVKYANLEISPCFNKSYPGLVGYVISCGYHAYVMPTKPEVEVREAFERNPMAALKEYCFVPPGTADARIEATYQDNWLFVRR